MTLLCKQSKGKYDIYYQIKKQYHREKYLYKICDNNIRKNITGIIYTKQYLRRNLGVGVGEGVLSQRSQGQYYLYHRSQQKNENHRSLKRQSLITNYRETINHRSKNKLQFTHHKEKITGQYLT